MEKRFERGITLVVLVITIIVLLILAGIAISALTGENGLFIRAQQAKEKTVEAQLKEKIIMAIQEIQAEELPKGNNVTLDTLADEKLESKLEDITVELVEDEINGEYKNYEYTIDSNLNVTINGEVSGAKISGTAEVQTAGYVFEGSTVDVKVTANVTEGTITGIEAPEGVTLKTDTSATEKVYTVSKSGKYIFKITSDSGKIKNIKAKVNNILSEPQIKIDNVTWNSFRINVENNYPEGAITEYRYSVGGTVKQQGTTDKSYTVTGLAELTEYNNIQVTAYINSESRTSNIENITTQSSEITYSWDEIAEMAKAISNNTSITDDSEIAKVNGKTLTVGQKKTLDGKTVRILGFNHDELAEPNTAYGSTTATGKAGISFEYVDSLITSTRMNDSNTNSGGWAETELRGTLNSTTYNSLSIKSKIEQVKKDYIPTYNVASTQQTEDYLWLLSCGEIWDNGYNKGVTRGYAITTEGKQYKYYKMNLENTSYSSENSILQKQNEGIKTEWWLRSPRGEHASCYCVVTNKGLCGDISGWTTYKGDKNKYYRYYREASNFSYVTPCFSI